MTYKMQAKNIVVEKYKSGTNLRIEAMLNMAPLEVGETLYRVNGPKGIKMMILPKGISDRAVREEYIRRYDVQPELDIEEETE